MSESPIDPIASSDEVSKDSERPNAVEQRRRAIFERSRAKFAAKGTPIDADPAFLQLMEDWIAGRLEMADVATIESERKLSGRQRGLPEPGPKDLPEATSATKEFLQSHHDLLDEMERSIGIYQPEQNPK